MASQATRRAPKAIDSYAQKLIRWRDHPAMMVREEFGAEPDAWQEEVLEAFPHQQRIAMACSKGPGKTTCLAWAAWNFILTRPHANVAMTSISGRNLQDGLWKELAKWQAKSELLKLLFEIQATRVVAKEAPKTWFMSARTWQQSASAEEQASTLAGFHAENVLFILDETGDMPAAVMVSAEAALSTGTDMKIMQAGNTTRREGPLWRACTADRERWYVVRISGDPDDAKRSPRISIDWCKQMIAAYGRQSDWVKVNVFGEFPDHAINALIGPDEIDAAEKRAYREHDIEHSPRLLGVDVAREGDDASVMFPRQGLVAFEPKIWRNIDGIQGAGAVARKWDEWGADACFVDNTGGFGASWIDCLRLLGRQAIPVVYSAEPHDRRYFNKRAEIYFLATQWIKDGGQLPHCPELTAALTQITYTHRNDRLLLEDKGQLKARLGFSPDVADSFCQTFAEPIVKAGWHPPGRRRSRHRFEYDPYAIRDDERIRG